MILHFLIAILAYEQGHVRKKQLTSSFVEQIQ